MLTLFSSLMFFWRFLLAPLGKKERRKERRPQKLDLIFCICMFGSSACLEFAASRPWAGVCLCVFVCALVDIYILESYNVRLHEYK
jgi:hypothetical protein